MNSSCQILLCSWQHASPQVAEVIMRFLPTEFYKKIITCEGAYQRMPIAATEIYMYTYMYIHMWWNEVSTNAFPFTLWVSVINSMLMGSLKCLGRVWTCIIESEFSYKMKAYENNIPCTLFAVQAERWRGRDKVSCSLRQETSMWRKTRFSLREMVVLSVGLSFGSN